MSAVQEEQLPEELQVIIDRLTSHQSSAAHLALPRKSQAGVLVLLCRNGNGGLSVILTTRALHMRSFPGETALPGGRMEETDTDIAGTALREAEEEIGLPTSAEHIRVIATLPPFLSKNLLFVIPVVALSNKSAQDLLASFRPNSSEVHTIWAWPLFDLLGLKDESKATPDAVRYAYLDVNWLTGAKYRLHEFHHKDMGSPITGLTADILLAVAMIAYNVDKPGFDRMASGQLSSAEMVQAVLDGKAGKDGDVRSALRKQRVTEDTAASIIPSVPHDAA